MTEQRRRRYLFEEGDGYGIVYARTPEDVPKQIVEDDWEGLWDEVTEIDIWDITDAPELTVHFEVTPPSAKTVTNVLVERKEQQ